MFINVSTVVRDTARCYHWISHQLEADFTAKYVGNVSLLKFIQKQTISLRTNHGVRPMKLIIMYH